MLVPSSGDVQHRIWLMHKTQMDRIIEYCIMVMRGEEGVTVRDFSIAGRTSLGSVMTLLFGIAEQSGLHNSYDEALYFWVMQQALSDFEQSKSVPR